MPNASFSLSCDYGDTLVNGYVKQFTSDSTPKALITGIAAYHFNGLDGYIIDFDVNSGMTETYDFVIICAKGTLPQN